MGVMAVQERRRVPANTIGRIVAVERDGTLFVRHDYHAEPLRASTILAVDVDAPLDGQPVLLAFADDDPLRPVLLGLLGDGALDPRLGAARQVTATEILLARNLDFRATDSISIRCGRSQILMDKFGKIIIKGRNVLTRAAERNRVKGGSISLN